MTCGARIHDGVTAANDETAPRIPSKADARPELLDGGIECGIGRIHAELLPLRGERIEESITVVCLVEGLIVLPSEPEVQGQFRGEFEIVLYKQCVREGA